MFSEDSACHQLDSACHQLDLSTVGEDAGGGGGDSLRASSLVPAEPPAAGCVPGKGAEAPARL